MKTEAELIHHYQNRLRTDFINSEIKIEEEDLLYIAEICTTEYIRGYYAGKTEDSDE